LRTGGYADESEVAEDVRFSDPAMKGSIATLRYTALLGPSSALKACRYDHGNKLNVDEMSREGQRTDTSSTTSCKNSSVCGRVENAWNTPLLTPFKLEQRLQRSRGETHLKLDTPPSVPLHARNVIGPAQVVDTVGIAKKSANMPSGRTGPS
jgi:hypothetical protein